MGELRVKVFLEDLGEGEETKNEHEDYFSRIIRWDGNDCY